MLVFPKLSSTLAIEMNEKVISAREQLRINTASNREVPSTSEQERLVEGMMKVGRWRENKSNEVSWSNNQFTRAEAREYLCISTQRNRPDLLPSEQNEHVDGKMRVLGFPDCKIKQSSRDVKKVKDDKADKRFVDFREYKRPYVDETEVLRAEREKNKSSK